MGLLAYMQLRCYSLQAIILCICNLFIGSIWVHIQTFQSKSIINIDYWDSLFMMNFVLGSADNRCVESLLQCQWSPHTTTWHRLCNTCRIHSWGCLQFATAMSSLCGELFYYFPTIICPKWTLFGRCSPDPRIGNHVLDSRSVGCN